MAEIDGRQCFGITEPGVSADPSHFYKYCTAMAAAPGMARPCPYQILDIIILHEEYRPLCGMVMVIELAQWHSSHKNLRLQFQRKVRQART